MNVFRLYPNGAGPSEPYYVDVKIDIKEEKGKYDIGVSYEFDERIKTKKERTSLIKRLELYDNDCDIYYEGDIIVKNELTDKLVEYLLLDDEFLQTKCGLEDVHSYRLGLLKMVQLLWA